ncbi:MAG: enoyl-[acyl-carrier-protein] reductase FabK [bacterium]|nr:enoyl-[acyl-carrier-protein] reductase FabK [bacterium]
MTGIRTPLTELLGIEHPVCLGPMGLISTPPMVAAVSEAGGIGIMGTAMLDSEKLREAIRQTRALTDKPFGISLMAAMPTSADLAKVAIEERLPFVTTSAGSPKRLAPVLRDAGIENYHVVPNVAMALKAKAAGCSGIIAEGSEGASFKSPDEISTLVLIPQVADATGLPVIGAGGIGDGRGLAAALCLGAIGVQMGTRFIATEESPIHENYKQTLLQLAETDTLMVGRKSGPLRVARNACSNEMAEFEKTTDDVAQLRSTIGYHRFPEAALKGEVDKGLVVAGQVVGMIKDIPPVKQLISRIVAEAAESLGRSSGFVRD